MRRDSDGKTKRRALLVTLLLVASSAVGAVGWGLAGPGRSNTTILSPFHFQLNGRDPYRIQVPLARGQTISGTINSSGAPLSFMVALQGVVVQSATVAGSYHFRFTAEPAGTYDLVFQAESLALVSIEVTSP